MHICILCSSFPSSALGNNYEEQLDARLAAVRGEIEEKGHYDLTYEELVFGARTAWRNAPRCINRIIWRQLEVETTCQVYVFFRSCISLNLPA